MRSELLEWVLWVKGTGGQRVELLDISKVMQLLVEIMVCKDVKYSYGMEEKIIDSIGIKEWRDQSVGDGSSKWMLKLPRMTEMGSEPSAKFISE